MADSVELTGLHAEFYQLVTAAVYHADGLWGDATFDLYARALPEGVGFMVAAGMEELVIQLPFLALLRLYLNFHKM